MIHPFKRRVLLAAFFVGAGFSARLSGQEVRGAQPDSAAADTIRARLAAWVEQTNRRDRGAAQTIWAPRSVCWFPGASLFGDSAAARIVGLSTLPSGNFSTYSLVIEEIVVAGEIAVVHDRWMETRHFPGVAATARRLIRGSELWRRQPDASWRIARCVSAPEAWERDGSR